MGNSFFLLDVSMEISPRNFYLGKIGHTQKVPSPWATLACENIRFSRSSPLGTFCAEERRSSARNVSRGEERGETDVPAGHGNSQLPMGDMVSAPGYQRLFLACTGNLRCFETSSNRDRKPRRKSLWYQCTASVTAGGERRKKKKKYLMP